MISVAATRSSDADRRNVHIDWSKCNYKVTPSRRRRIRFSGSVIRSLTERVSGSEADLRTEIGSDGAERRGERAKLGESIDDRQTAPVGNSYEATPLVALFRILVDEDVAADDPGLR